MKTIHPRSLRLSRRLKQFNLSLLAALAALALTACGGVDHEPAAATSLSRGVQHILAQSSIQP